MKTEEEIKEMLERVSEKVAAIADGKSEGDGGSFEDGAESTLAWILYEESEPPVEFDESSDD